MWGRDIEKGVCIWHRWASYCCRQLELSAPRKPQNWPPKRWGRWGVCPPTPISHWWMAAPSSDSWHIWPAPSTHWGLSSQVCTQTDLLRIQWAHLTRVTPFSLPRIYLDLSKSYREARPFQVSLVHDKRTIPNSCLPINCTLHSHVFANVLLFSILHAHTAFPQWGWDVYNETKAVWLHGRIRILQSTHLLMDGH